MPSSKKPRKRMTPKPALVNPILFRTAPDQDRNLKLIPHQELVELREGRGTETSWHTLAGRINWASVLAMSHEFSDDPKPTIKAGLDALRSLKARYEKNGKYVLTGDELRAIGDALTLADDMQDATTRRHHRDALRIVLKTGT